MRKHFTANKYLPTALTLFGLAIAGGASASAQSVDRIWGVLPYYYVGTGAQVRGTWAPPAAAAIPPRVAPASQHIYMYAPHGLKHR
jgi:hypothetical protein